MKNLKKILFLLSSKERKQAVLLLIMIIIMALLDMLGVASILPFMAVLTNPDLIETNSILNFAFQSASIFGVENKNHFIFMLGLVVFLLLIISLTFKALTNYFQTLFITMREYAIGKRLVEGYLNQPYSWFLSQNSANLGKSILSELSTVIGNAIQPMINLIGHGAVVISITSLLIINDPLMTLITGITLGGCYFLIYIFLRGYIKKIGQQRFEANEKRFKILSEAFGASKEIKLGGLENIYINRFENPAKTFAQHQASIKIISQLPRFALEAVAFGGMLLLSLYFMSKSGAFINAIPVIALYTFAGYRLMPALQNIYVALAQLRFAGTALDTLHKDLQNKKYLKSIEQKDFLKFNKSISLDQIHYHYPNSSNYALKNINLNIPARSKVGIVGSTGSGKTTTVDIILGLLEAHKGTLKVDEKIIDGQNRRSWQNCIGYVPQQIYLADDTIEANIAFGILKKEINQQQIEKVSKIASLHEFVNNELPDKYQTIIGERGVRLSGGQRQRIGIARALYHSPKLLVFDEATSALDNITEQIVMKALNNLDKNTTVILIAHRLSTVQKCDTIFLIENGEVKANGSFNELLKSNLQFRKMHDKEK